MHEKELEKVAEDRGVEVKDLKLEDLADSVAPTDISLSTSRASFTLENAVIAGPPGFVEHEIGTVRIQTAQIGAWWLFGFADEDLPSLSGRLGPRPHPSGDLA